MVNNQVAKFVNSKEKDGIVKVLALKAFMGGEDRSNGKMEPSLLHRFGLEGHYVQRKDAKGNILPEDEVIKKSFMGNLPIEKLPALIELSLGALKDKTFNNGEGGKISLLPAEWKPIMREKDAKGNPKIYCLEVTYMGNLSLPIQVKLSNAYAPVITAQGGKTNIQLRETYGKEELVMYVSADEWYNSLVNARDNWLTYRNRVASDGYFDEEFLLKK